MRCNQQNMIVNDNRWRKWGKYGNIVEVKGVRLAMNQIDMYNTVYGILNDLTPLHIDCGKLCNHICCKGDGETGMLLFPNEEDRFIGEAWAKLLDTEYILSDGTQLKLLICDGACPRDKRPLSCRIFPLFGCLDMDDALYVDIDPRAVNLCPLAKIGLQLEVGISRAFEDAVWDVFELLVQDKQCCELIDIMSDEFAAYNI